MTLTSNVITVAENGGAGTVTATLSVATYADVIVELGGTEDEAGTATEGTDYTSDYTTAITISAGSLTGTTSGASIADDIYEGNETVNVPIDSVSGGGATESGDQLVTITIIDSLAAPTVTLTSSAASIAEPVSSSSSLTLTATLNRSTYETVTVTLSTSGTSTAGTDYASLSSITISAGNITGSTTFNPTPYTLF